MNDTTPRYITTTLPYVNADPHIGFAIEIIQADALARHWRAIGHDVFFNTGTDEHGQKIAQKADEAGQDRQAYVDHYAGEFNKLKDALNLSYDRFIRTTDVDHIAAAQEMWRRCDAAGDIYKQAYNGLYCVGCEAFKTESDLVDGCCPIHQKAPENIEEENYFFRLSNYEAYLTEYLADASHTLPDWRREELQAFVADGLEDISISRQRSRMNWGVPVPGDDEHVMYVWFDALTNYISTLGWPNATAGESDEDLFEKFWEGGETWQVAGKDQTRFQSVIWQAMLKSAGVPGTDRIVYHGFVNSGGQKMSKSLGNVISPYEMVDRYGTDATRYILLRHVHPFDDSDLTWEKMDEYYTANLVNGLGNLTARIMKMAETHLDAPVALSDAAPDSRYLEALSAYEFHNACDIVWEKIGTLDEKITETEPFKLVKEDKPAAQAIITELVQGLYEVGCLLRPIMPEAHTKVTEAACTNTRPENLFVRIDT